MTKNKQNKKEISPADQDDQFLDGILGVNEVSSGLNLNLRPPTLSTIAILQRINSPIFTGASTNESETLIHGLIFIWMHTADVADVHSAALMTDSSGRNPILEKKALELGEKIEAVKAQELLQSIVEYVTKHLEAKVEPIPPKDGAKGSDEMGNE